MSWVLPALDNRAYLSATAADDTFTGLSYFGGSADQPFRLDGTDAEQFYGQPSRASDLPLWLDLLRDAAECAGDGYQSLHHVQWYERDASLVEYDDGG
jgi:hypothetical protein